MAASANLPGALRARIADHDHAGRRGAACYALSVNFHTTVHLLIRQRLLCLSCVLDPEEMTNEVENSVWREAVRFIQDDSKRSERLHDAIVNVCRRLLPIRNAAEFHKVHDELGCEIIGLMVGTGVMDEAILAVIRGRAEQQPRKPRPIRI